MCTVVLECTDISPSLSLYETTKSGNGSMAQPIVFPALAKGANKEHSTALSRSRDRSEKLGSLCGGQCNASGCV